ncbi:hypothetical protein O9929_25920 [Vibrio lentus]|nr:hypothetical protein [Vibrio lentus]
MWCASSQCPSTTGEVRDLTDIIAKAQANKHWLAACATDLLASALLKPAGEMGADVVIGSAQPTVSVFLWVTAVHTLHSWVPWKSISVQCQVVSSVYLSDTTVP